MAALAVVEQYRLAADVRLDVLRQELDEFLVVLLIGLLGQEEHWLLEDRSHGPKDGDTLLIAVLVVEVRLVSQTPRLLGDGMVLE